MSRLTLPTPAAPSWPRVPSARSPLTHVAGCSSRPPHQQRRHTRLHQYEWRWKQWRGHAPDGAGGGGQQWRTGGGRYDQGTSVPCPRVATPPQKHHDLTALRAADGRPPPPAGLALHFSRLAVRSIGRGERGRSRTVAAQVWAEGRGWSRQHHSCGSPSPIAGTIAVACRRDSAGKVGGTRRRTRRSRSKPRVFVRHPGGPAAQSPRESSRRR